VLARNPALRTPRVLRIQYTPVKREYHLATSTPVSPTVRIRRISHAKEADRLRK
jgi:hypothetical protein